MFSSSSNSIWASTTYTQEVGDGNWTQYQVQLTGGATPLAIKTANTTATSLALRTVGTVSAGDGLLLSTNGTTFTSGIAGNVTAGVASTNFTLIPGKTVAQSSNLPTPAALGGMKISTDGKLFWRGNGTNIIEYAMSTPFDPTTATATGKSVPATAAFDISSDGRFMFYNASTTTLYRTTLATPWDVSSGIQTNYVTLGSATITTASVKALRLSKDGTKLYTFRQSTGVLYQIPLPRAFDVTSAGATTNSYTLPVFTVASFDISDDGKKFTFFDIGTLLDSGTPNIYSGRVLQYTCSTPWDISTMTLTSTFVTGAVLYGASGPLGGYVSNDGTQTTIMMNNSYATYSSDINIHQTIDISSFNLGSAPTLAYTKVPSISVSTASAASKISLSPYQLHMVSSNVANAIVGHSVANAISAGDTLLLNGSNSVTISTVAEVANGIAASQTFVGATYVNSVATGFTIDTINGMTFSPDGSKLFISGTGPAGLSGIYKYTLTTPWDITTAAVKDLGRDYIKNPAASTTYGCTCDFSPDGKKIFIVYNTNSATNTIAEYSLANAWDLATVNSTATTTKTFDASYATMKPKGGKFSPNGLLFYFGIDLSNSNNSYHHYAYFTMSTPYTLSTASAVTVSNPTPWLQGPGVLLPSGSYWLASDNTATAGAFTLHPLTSFDFSTLSAQSATTGSMPTQVSAGSLRSVTFSTDGSKAYVVHSASSSIYQFSNPFLPLHKYTMTMPTQSAAPTSFSIPERTTLQTLTSVVSGNNIVSTGSAVSANARAISFKITNNGPVANVTNATINLWK